jgi:peptidoglycan/xylan/chitin deacetylase (PgdA/CDA1 family)
MRIPGSGRLRRYARMVRGAVAPGALILLYHRVFPARSDPYGLSVSPSHFGEHLEILRTAGRPARLQQLATELQHHRLVRRTFVVTFDDGYADNLHRAKPLLDRYDVPATVFVTAGYVGQGREFWWDTLERVLVRAERISGTPNGTGNGSAPPRDLQEIARLIQDRHQKHRVAEARNETGRGETWRLRDLLWRRLRPLPHPQRQTLLEGLVARCAPPQDSPVIHRALTRDELVRLADGGLVDIGAHTVTHPLLSALPAPAQRAEIETSKEILEDILTRPVATFSYPYGTRLDYTPAAASMVRGAGFTCACSGIAGAVRGSSNLFELPRMLVQDWDGETFARHVREWLGA